MRAIMISITLDQSVDKPIYRQLAQAFITEIREGRLRSGEKLPSETDLATTLAINPYTVSRAYEELAKQGVLIQRRGLGTRVAPEAWEAVGLARECRLRKITVVTGAGDLSTVPNFERFITLGLIAGLTEVAEAAAVEVRWVRELTSILPGGPEAGEGIVVQHAPGFGYGHMDLDWTMEAHRRKLQLVAVGCQSRWPGFPTINYDRYEAVKIVCRHLIECGYRSIGFIGELGSSSAIPCIKFLAYVETLREAGLDMIVRHVLGGECYRPGQAHRAAIELLNRKPLPDAIFVDTDYKAIEVICALQSRGIATPQDIGVAGYDGVEEGQMFDPPLTTVSVDWKEMGRRAAHMLLDWSSHGEKPENIMMGTELLIGKTTLCKVEK